MLGPVAIEGAAMARTGTTSRGRSDQTLELAELLTHATRRLRRCSAEHLSPLGLTMVQARVLRIVAEQGAVRMADIAARLDVVPRTATSLVDGLEAAGLVR